MNLTPERKAEIHAWIADILRDPDCLFLDTQTETELAAVDFMIMYYQKELSTEAQSILLAMRNHCIFCQIAGTCYNCVWRLEPRPRGFSTGLPCVSWLPYAVYSFSELLSFKLKDLCTERIAMLHRWRAALIATLPDGKIYCGECFKETSINRIELLESDNAYGHTEYLRSYEYLSTCCSDDRFYSNAACTAQFSQAEIAELWRDANE